MKTVNTELDFEALPTYQYMEYVHEAERIQRMGIHSDMDVMQLAKIIFEKKEKNESEDSQSNR